ncbi:MAG: hypothetical protein ACPG6V_01695 [Flavobacteriales bacterium]
MRNKLVFILTFFTFSFCYSQENIKIVDYVKINDIGIKIIDKKKLKKDIEDEKFSKDQLKTLKQRLKIEEKEAKSAMKIYNAEVYKKRREEEFAIRSGAQSATVTDTALDVSNEELFAKKVDKVFDEKVVEEIPEDIDSVDVHPVVPEKRSSYPWATELEQKPCDWDIFYIDHVEKDTVFKSNTHTVFYNKKKESDVPQAKVDMTIVKENNKYFFDLKFEFFNLEQATELKLKKGNLIRFTLKNKETVIIPFSGFKQKATVSSDFSKQMLSGRYRMSAHMLKSLSDNKWKKLHVTIGEREFNLIFSKNFTSKAKDSDVAGLFKSQLLCIQNL